MIEPLRGWTRVSIRAEGQQYLVHGTDVWTCTWRSIDQRIIVAHPTFREQRHPLSVYALPQIGPHAYVAAGELSAGVWGLCQPA